MVYDIVGSGRACIRYVGKPLDHSVLSTGQTQSTPLLKNTCDMALMALVVAGIPSLLRSWCKTFSASGENKYCHLKVIFLIVMRQSAYSKVLPR